ncbi:uncharacterized protein LOC142606415 [Castanea sativa]|uniref:uncharacterized protein LOC142606415 n=1 Tax=Castanea sativa TaxID=21020 RepID=UPI003F65067F
MPWLCAKDFNKILWSHEKLGLGPRRETPMKAFREVLYELGLKDLRYVGRKFTWKGRRQGGFVLECLDPAVANNQWLSLNPGTRVQHLHSNSLDHQAIIVKPEGISPNPRRTFKFKQIWLRDRGCSNTVNSAWGPSILGATMPMVAGKVQACGVKLTEWNKNSFGSVRKMLEEKRKLQTRAELDAAKGGDQLVVKSLQREINEILDKESQLWQHRSLALFLKCGDRNTTYFHIEYYQSLFSSSSPSEFSDILEKVQPSVTDSMTTMLLRDFNKKEVEIAIKQMKPITAPDPDSMPPLFYQSFWNTVGDDVCSTILDCLQSCKIPREINLTHIALIPKVKSPERISEFRPISLCSVIYKVWGHYGNQRKIHWSKWSMLCLPKDLGGMGFKELKKFNDAMLTKQVWRLLEDKSSLFHRFFKAKIFPNGTIFYVKEDKGSFAWKSILKGREIIKNGAQWRVGNGENILIYKDCWLLDPQYTRIQSPLIFYGCDAQVLALIDMERRCWIDDAIDNNFLPLEAKLIKSIPLSLNVVEDKLYWRSNVDGIYSVKSGYRLLVDDELSSNVGSSNLSLSKNAWKGLWKLRTPN